MITSNALKTKNNVTHLPVSDKSTQNKLNSGQGYKAALAIKSLSVNNEGVYFCEMTFNNSQTINVSLIADVIGLRT